MELWDREAIDLLGPARITFEGASGEFRFIAVQGAMACRYSTDNGEPQVEFTWHGSDECDEASGEGWASIERDTLVGAISFCTGDESDFTAVRWTETDHETA